MSRKLVVPVILGVGVSSIAVASASSLGGLNSAGIATDEVPSVTCVQAVDAVSTGVNFSAVELFVEPAGCTSGSLNLTLADSSNTSLASTSSGLGGGLSSLSSAVNYDDVAFSAAAVTGGLAVESDYQARVASWQLDDLGIVTALDDNFETFSGWTTFGAGIVVPSTDQSLSGSASGLKTGENDPAGAYKQLSSPVADFEMSVFIYRSATVIGGQIDRTGLENANFDGYSFAANHSSNTLSIDRRAAGDASPLPGSVPFDPPEEQWYEMRLRKQGSTLTAEALDLSGTLLATVSTTDTTTTSFDRFVVHGGWDYYIDDVKVTTGDPVVTVVDAAGTISGVPLGAPGFGAPPLSPGSLTSVDFDGIDDMIDIPNSAPVNNPGSLTGRSISLKFNADSAADLRPQIIWEEGGNNRGLNLYVYEGRLYARAFDSGWSNDLEVSTPVSSGADYHAAVVLDPISGKSLELFVNGVSVGTSTKTDATGFRNHNGGVAIGGQNGGTVLHAAGLPTQRFFDGRVDSVEIFNTLFTTRTVARLAAN